MPMTSASSFVIPFGADSSVVVPSLAALLSGSTNSMSALIPERLGSVQGKLNRIDTRFRGLPGSAQNLGLHSFNFQAVTASSSLEFPHAGGLAHLRQPPLEAEDRPLAAGLLQMLTG
jgi:hypothetical protein